jgi:AraC-like DNA-binding protein
VTLQGALFANGEFSSPWGFRSPDSRAVAPYIGPDAGHVIVYHVVLDGPAWAQLESGPRVALRPGDIVMFPQGDPHRMGAGPVAQFVDTAKELGRVFARGLDTVRMGGGGEVTRVVCGFMSCDPQLGQALLGALPRMLTVNIKDGDSGAWLENAILFSVANAGSGEAGGAAVLAKLSEALFVETLRRYLASQAAGETGWTAGARDPEVGKALALLHRRPERRWTIGELAAAVGVSRAVLAERFRQFLGEPPIAYLTRWRLQLGARMLTTTSRGVAQIAGDVGYDSEAAFNRAFKRRYGAPPARYRREALRVGNQEEAARFAV